MNITEGLDVATGVTDTGLSLSSTIAKLIPTKRSCTIELTNESSNYILCNPSVYIESGRCTIPLPPCIRPSSTGEALFAKTANTARGAVGMFTYDLVDISTKNSSEKIAVLFKVPFNLKAKSNEYAVGIFAVHKECNRDLFYDISKNSNTTFVRGKAKGPSLTLQRQNITIMATMSNCYETVMKVEVSDH